jgi:hypothetical protein
VTHSTANGTKNQSQRRERGRGGVESDILVSPNSKSQAQNPKKRDSKSKAPIPNPRGIQKRKLPIQKKSEIRNPNWHPCGQPRAECVPKPDFGALQFVLGAFLGFGALHLEFPSNLVFPLDLVLGIWNFALMHAGQTLLLAPPSG